MLNYLSRMFASAVSFGAWLTILIYAILGALFASQFGMNPLFGVILGAVVGFFFAVFVFGLIALLIRMEQRLAVIQEVLLAAHGSGGDRPSFSSDASMLRKSAVTALGDAPPPATYDRRGVVTTASEQSAGAEP